MEQIKKNKFLIIFFLILVGISVYLLYFINNKDVDYFERNINEIKRYQENEYIPVNITYDQIARIYLQDYVYKLLYNREEAFNLLDEEYRKTKFKSYDDFDKYVKEFLYSKKLIEMSVKKYSITDNINYKDFDVYDSGENLFIFRETGVMQYTVFLDRNTVKM